MRVRNTRKIGIISGLLLIVLLVNFSRVAKSYEISIYQSIGPYVWIAVVLVFGLSLVVLAKYPEYSSVGVFLSLICSTFLFSAPLIRGYYMYGVGDAMTHVGKIRQVLIAGKIEDISYYPAIYIFGSIVSNITNQSANFSRYIIPIFVSIIFIGSLYKCIERTSILRYGSVSGLSLWFTLLPTYTYLHIYFGPNSLSFFILPLIIYCLYKPYPDFDKRYFIILLTIASSQVIWHPSTSLLTILVIGSYLLLTYTSSSVQASHRSMTMLLGVYILLYLIWNTEFVSVPEVLAVSLLDIFSLFSGVSSSSQVGHYNQALQQIPLSFSDLISVIIVRKGSELLVLLLGGLAAVRVIYSKISSHTVDDVLIHSTFLFIGFSVLSVILLLTDVVLSWTRILKYALFFGTVTFALTASRYKFGITRNHTTKFVLGVLVASVLVVGMYPSPMSREPNPQVTLAQTEGSEWAFDNLSQESNISGYNPGRYYQFLNSRTENWKQYSQSTNLPSNLGYNISTKSLGESYSGGYVISSQIRQYYKKIHPDYKSSWKWNPDDFRKLAYDPSVARVYDNGEVRTYYIT